MALIKCSECQKEVSDKAYTCPNCGCPIATKVGDGTVKIKLPRTEQMADGWVGLFSSKDARIIANGKTIWNGKHGETANFKIEKATSITIDLGTWGNPVNGTIEPNKKYELIQDYGFHMKATFRLSEVDTIDSGR